MARICGSAHVERPVDGCSHVFNFRAHPTDPLRIIVDEDVAVAGQIHVVLVDSAQVTKDIIDLGIGDVSGRVCAGSLLRV